MASGLLTVVNPRRRRRNKRRKVHRAKATHHKRRRRRVARAANPAHHRRRARRRNPRHRRRHRNPFGIGGGMVGTLTKGLALGGGAVATNLVTNGVNYLIGGGKAATGKQLDGLAKTGLKAAIGLVALPMLIRFVPGGAKFAGQVRMGAGIAIAFDLYDQYVKAKLPIYLQDYQYGALSEWAPLGNYERGALTDWAPQAQAVMAGSGPYDAGIYE